MSTDETQAGAAAAPAGRETNWRALDALCEAEPVEPDIDLARLRLRQAEERIVSRFPRTAQDGQLASILEGLGDALGRGPEASEQHYAEAQKTDIFRRRLSPDLWLVTEASCNVVLEVTTPHGRVVRRVLVSPKALQAAMADAVMAKMVAEAQAEEDRGTAVIEAERKRRRSSLPNILHGDSRTGVVRRTAAERAAVLLPVWGDQMADEATGRIQLAALLREAAGVSSADWVMSDAEVRQEIHERGARELVEAAGHDMAAWEELPPLSPKRSAVLLRGARVLGIATEWEGWA